MAEKLPKVRLDKWLWAARFFRTRGLAKAAIEAGKVHCAGQRVKVAKEIAVGDKLTIRQGFDKKDIVVLALSEQRRRASDAAQLYKESDASIAARQERAADRKAVRAGFTPGETKPTKRERRQLQRFRQGSE